MQFKQAGGGVKFGCAFLFPHDPPCRIRCAWQHPDRLPRPPGPARCPRRAPDDHAQWHRCVAVWVVDHGDGIPLLRHKQSESVWRLLKAFSASDGTLGQIGQGQAGFCNPMDKLTKPGDSRPYQNGGPTHNKQNQSGLNLPRAKSPLRPKSYLRAHKIMPSLAPVTRGTGRVIAASQDNKNHA